MAEQFSNLAQTTLSAGISAGATSLSVASASAFPSSGNFRIIIDSEIFLVTAVSGGTFTVIPGYEGTTEANHANGATVTHILTAGIMRQLMGSAAGSVIINGLGDSITSQSAYFPADASIALAPAWHASTAVSTGALCQNGGNVYRCASGGTTASSGGPSGTSSGISDNTATWAYVYTQGIRYSTSYLFWAEKLSQGRLWFDMSQGYTGIANSVLKILVAAAGSGYTAPTVTLSNGATATVQTSGGLLTGVTVTNPGYVTGAAFTASLSDSTGTGGVISIVTHPSGTFGVPGCQTADMVARLADVSASAADIIVVHGGTNDISGNVSYSTITANLRTCYETLIAAGKKVIAVPILPRTGLTTTAGGQTTMLLRVNNWIRYYCRKNATANPYGMTTIVCADPTRYFTDGTNATNQPVGGSGAGADAMLQDGLHPSPRGAYYMGLEIWKAAQAFCAIEPSTTARAASYFDGFDLNLNPTGNGIEALPWQASTAVSVASSCSNSSNLYRCKTAGTTASSGGPTGTGSTISDGTAQWAYLRPQGCSVFASGTSGTQNAATGVTYSGSLASGYVMGRTSGSASGTVSFSIENPWSDGQTGQRQVITFSLGSGSNSEFWQLYVNSFGTSGYGILSSELGNTAGKYYAECELELSSVANLIHAGLLLSDANLSSPTFIANDGVWTTNGTGSNLNMPNSTSEMVTLPDGGRMILRTQPMMLPTQLASLVPQVVFAFNASGGAGSATATVKLNYLSLKRSL